MLHLLQPIWLLAASGIIIPIAIHLWNIKQGKTLKVGSIAFLTRTSQEHASSLRLTELFLLLLRCLLIILLALLLAQPYWLNTGSGKGWILMEKKDVQQAYTHFKPLTDSLLQAGYEFHLLEDGFEKREIQSVLKEDTDTTEKNQTSYWNLVKQLDKKLPQGFPVYLFTDNRLTRFSGARPEASIALRWETFTNKDSTDTFISNAYTTFADSVVVIMGETNPSNTIYTQQVIALNRPKQKDLVLDVINGSLSVRYKDQAPVLVDTTTLHITVFADTYSNDARYIQSALQSIQQVSRKKIKLAIANKPGEIAAKQDWLFWLSGQPVPANVHADNILVYEEGDEVSVQSWMSGDNNETLQVPLYKRIAIRQSDVAYVWRDGFGNPLLTKETSNAKQLYRFYSHFDPSWNDLVWNASFPQLIYGLIDRSVLRETVNEKDQRIIGETQIQLNKATGKKNTDIQNIDTTKAEHVLWLVIFALFLIERFFSFKPKKEPVYA